VRINLEICLRCCMCKGMGIENKDHKFIVCRAIFYPHGAALEAQPRYEDPVPKECVYQLEYLMMEQPC
jgi:hypothetical protein